MGSTWLIVNLKGMLFLLSSSRYVQRRENHLDHLEQWIFRIEGSHVAEGLQQAAIMSLGHIDTALGAR
jgi:hypothetical protein